MKRTTVVKLTNVEDVENNTQSLSVSIDGINEDGTPFPVNKDVTIGMMERAKMQTLGEQFMKGARDLAFKASEVDRLQLQAAKLSLDTGLEIVKSFFKNKKSGKKKVRRQPE